MLIALAFAHFSSELLLKEQMIIPVKTTLNAGHIDAKLIDFSEIYQKKSSEIGSFLLIVSWRSFPPRNFPWNQPIFLRICPWKSFENWLFSAKIPRNRPIFLQILTFLPRKSREIGRLFREFWLFSRENPAKSADFSANLPLKIPRNFFFLPRNIRNPACKWREVSSFAIPISSDLICIIRWGHKINLSKMVSRSILSTDIRAVLLRYWRKKIVCSVLQKIDNFPGRITLFKNF